MKRTIILCVALLLSVSAVYAGSITLISGNAPIGQRDPLVTVRGGTVSINGYTYPMPAVGSKQALVINKNHDWTTLSGSNWVGVVDGESDAPDGGYIYQSVFELPSSFTHAEIALTMTCDNFGKAYLNGNLLGTVLQEPPSTFTRLFKFNSSNRAYFVSGTNVLQFRVANAIVDPSIGNPTGLIFKADVSYVPEPASILGVLTGLTGMFGLLRRKTI